MEHIGLSVLALIIGASLFVPTASIAFWLAREPIFGLGDLWSSLFNSAKGALPAAVLAVLFALPLAYLGVRYSSRLSRIFERVAYLGYAIPPLALALSLIFFTLQTVPALYQTLVLLIIAYTLHFLAEAIGPLRSGLYQTSIRLEEAARTLGLGRLRILRRITLPLLRAGILSSLSLVFLSAMKELPLTFLLAPLGHATLATNIWSYTSEAMFANAAPYALLILLTAGLSVGLFISQEK